MAIRRSLATLHLATLAPGGARAEASTLASLLAEMTDPAAIARWPAPESTCRQASSHDRSKVSPDQPGWFGNDDRDRHLGREEAVLMDADGPGAVVRFWQTSGRPAKGRQRVYFDGANEAALGSGSRRRSLLGDGATARCTSTPPGTTSRASGPRRPASGMMSPCRARASGTRSSTSRARDHGIVRLSANGREVATSDGYSQAFASVPVVLGKVAPDARGKLTLRSEVIGTNPRAVGAQDFVGLDALRLEAPGR